MDPLVLDIADTAQLLADENVIAASMGFERRVHQMTKKSSPVVDRTEPYEGDYIQPISVIYDEQAGHWRMWYSSYGPRRVTLPHAYDMTLHTAVSPDGLQWEKRPVNLYAIDGNSNNNICIFDDGSPAQGACVVFDEPADPDPSKRYKLIYYKPSYYLAYSADGVTWRPAQPDPVWPNGAGDGLEECYFFMRDELVGKYRGYMRVWQRHQTIRKTSLGESDDLIDWTGPKIIWEAEPVYGIGAQLYGMNVVIEGGIYWALPWIFYNHQPLDPARQQTMCFKLAWSRDGIEWQAHLPEQNAVPMGEAGAFDCGMMHSSCPIVKLDDRLRLYYIGTNIRHNIEQGGAAAIGVAEIRRCGFLSLHADGEGVLLTRRFLFRGDHLRLNAITKADGYVEAELLNDAGAIIAANDFKHSDPFTGDAVDHVLTWRGQRDLSALYGQNVMLRLKVRNADVYSFDAAGSKERFTAPLGPPPVRCGPCTSPPVIDGVLSDNCWMDFTNSGIANDFVHFTEPSPAPVRTKVWMTRDDENLYIAVDCDEPQTDQLHLAPVAGEVDYSRDDLIEFRLSAPHQGTYFNQLMVTAGGSRVHCWFSVEEGGSRVLDTIDWQAATSVIPGHWYIEMAVPFKALRTDSPKPGEKWQMNIIRHRHIEGKDDRSCWSCMYGNLHRNDRSGMLVFV